MKTFSLREEPTWKIDLYELNAAVTDQTWLIAICSPNNPTGYILAAEERKAVIRSASCSFVWQPSNDVYAGIYS